MILTQEIGREQWGLFDPEEESMGQYFYLDSVIMLNSFEYFGYHRAAALLSHKDTRNDVQFVSITMLKSLRK